MVWRDQAFAPLRILETCGYWVRGRGKDGKHQQVGFQLAGLYQLVWGDERMLGDSDFVQSVLEAEHEKMEQRTGSRPRA